MAIEIKVPTLPESVSDATIAKWYKKAGDFIKRDEKLVDLETDKVMLEVPAPANAIVETIHQKEGEIVEAAVLLATLRAADQEPKNQPNDSKAASQKNASSVSDSPTQTTDEPELSPAVRRLIAMDTIDISQIVGTGKGGRITKEDVTAYQKQRDQHTQPAEGRSSPAPVDNHAIVETTTGDRTEKRVPMSRLRQRIAERLVQVQHEAALLTTFNEVNMQSVMSLRKTYGPLFEKKFGIRLGFMSFFSLAVVHALQQYPAVNASIDAPDIIYHRYCDIGIAVGSPRGLVVPILRNTEQMQMSDIEKKIRYFSARAAEGALTLEDMTGGTFTITNGGIYGSMLSTPIINPPQTAILGMHNIIERPIAEAGQVVIRPMMYLALSYDHRVIDGREAVLFLATIKQMLECPERMILGV